MNAGVPALDHRGDVQALRAWAVLAVIGHHVDVPGLGGGFLGVDLFLVLSGYLITRLLLVELAAAGRVRLGRFAARRIRRLLPASALVVLVTVAVSGVLLTPLQRLQEVAVARGAALFGANVVLAGQEADYFTAGRTSVLQHYWSLGVEEQFYLLWPALLYLAWRVARRRGVAVALVVVLASSLVLAGAWGTARPSAAFFQLPARAWQLAAGALVAWVELRGGVPARRRSWTALGIAALLGGVVLAGLDPAARLEATIAVTFGAAALVWAGVRRPDAGGASRFARAVHAVGDRSYVLYLWHWPGIVLAEAVLGRAGTSVGVRVSVVVATVVLSEATHRFVEDPLHHGSLLVRPRAAAVFLVVAVAVQLLVVQVALPYRAASSGAGPGSPPTTAELAVASVPEVVPQGLRPSLVDAVTDRPVIYENGCHHPAAPRTIEVAACTFGDVEGRATVALVGDSHAAHWFPAAERAAIDRGWRLLVVTKSGCALASGPAQREGAPYPACDAWRRDALDVLAADDVDVVLLGAAADHEQRLAPDDWSTARTSAFELVRDELPGAQVVALLDVPRPVDRVPICLERRSPAACGAQRDHAFDRLQLEAAVAADVEVVDASAVLCRGEVCPAVLGEVLVWRDDDHLTRVASAALGDLLGEAVLRALRGAG